MRSQNFWAVVLVGLLLEVQIGRAWHLSDVLGKYEPLNINEVVMWYDYSHIGASAPSFIRAAAFYPTKQTQMFYVDGLAYGGYVLDGREPVLRVNGSYFASGMQPGWIVKSGSENTLPKAISPDNQRVRLYRFRHDFYEMTEDDYRQEIATLLNINPEQVTDAQIDTLRKHYQKNLAEWPADLGAPYYDRNHNGKYDPDYDEPGIAGADQVIWFVTNDLSESKSWQLFGGLPSGMEVQVTAWAYKTGFSSVIFRRYRLINKSGAVIDSMYIRQFVDCNIGNNFDDLCGCDSLWMYGFAYNGSDYDKEFSIYNMPPPAMACILLQGPLVPAEGHIGTFDFKSIEGYKNLPMTSFFYVASGGPSNTVPMGTYQATLHTYAVMQGYANYPSEPFYHMLDANYRNTPPTFFPLNGNPVTGKGDVDGRGYNTPPGTRHFSLQSGPFKMNPGDVQEIIVAYVFALPDGNGNYLSAVKNLQLMVPTVFKMYDEFKTFVAPTGPFRPAEKETRQPDSTGVTYFLLAPGAPNPFSNQTTIKFRLLKTMDIQLDIFNMLGQKVKTIFQGSLTRGEHVFAWNGTDDYGRPLPTGVYLIRLKHGALIRWKKIIRVH